MDLLDGDTPRKKYQSLIELRNRNVRMSQALQKALRSLLKTKPNINN